MKINKQRLKFARDNRYIIKVLNNVFENFDITKLKMERSRYIYNDSIWIESWIGGAYEHGNRFELMINDEFFEDEVVIGLCKTLQRDKLLHEYYEKFNEIYIEKQKLWEDNKEKIKNEFLCEMYKKRNIDKK